jgi:hypothetical protein
MFDPVRICEVLNEEGVDYVIVGGLATIIHGSPLPTLDVDIVPSRVHDNLVRLARALTRMNAMIRTGREPVPVVIDAGFLAAMPVMLNLVTDHGDVDLTFEPSGHLAGFDDWNVDALRVEIAPGTEVRVASLDDVIQSKRAANRAKDLMALPYLESLREARSVE